MKPDKEPFALNDEQREAAYCGGNAVAAAGAGSGKTMVLASRFAWLVTEKKYRVREILTLTFTRKAAAQMYRRIHLMLAEIAGGAEGEQSRLARQALDEFTQARIQTLDSYCASIVRQAAHRYGINPGFSIDEDRCRQLAVNEALPFLIAQRNHQAIVRLYPWKSPMSIAGGLFAPALYDFTHFNSPIDPQQDMKRQCAVICKEWKKQSGIIGDKLNELAQVYSGHEKYHQDLAPVLSRYTAGKICFPEERELRLFFDQLTEVPPGSAAQWAESSPLYGAIGASLEFMASIYGLDMRKGSPTKNPAKEIIKELKALYGEFSSLAVFCLQAGLIYPVLMLLGELQQRYLNRKRAAGILTYGDVARLAHTILLEQPDIRLSEKESFKAIMIDEFQDNNRLQKDLLFLLAERSDITNAAPSAADLSPGKLFFVGDEKQSIYRFRGADVSVFRTLQRELGSGLPLKTNYRSSPLLIGAFNAIFGGSRFDPTGESPLSENPAVFALAAPSLPDYEASFTPLRADKHSEGKLTFLILDKQDSGDFPEETDRLTPVENEARFVAERIDALLREHDESGKPLYQPRDIAILFRSRSPQHYYEKHLMLLNIPYASEDLNGFFYGGPVNDLMSVLRLAVYPGDRAAYAQMLRSPFAGLSLPALAACLDSGDCAIEPFGDEPLPLLGGEDREKYGYGRRIYQQIRGSICTRSISSLVSELWFGQGYRYETEWNPQTAAYREMYDYLFHLAAQADENNLSLAAFVDDIQNLGQSGERLTDIEIPLERPSAVRLMTIHKSKGLEFPVVFLCCCDKHGRNDYSGDIFDSGQGITFAPPLPPQYAHYKDIKRSFFGERSLSGEKKKRTAELRRLLYVGMTRAMDQLYLSGCQGISGASGDDSGGDTEPGNFALQCRQFITSKIENAAGKNTIAGDSILDDDTFFGLLLPALNAFIPQGAQGARGGLDPQQSFFSIVKIPAYNEQYIYEAERHGSRFANNQQGLHSFFDKAKDFYTDAHTIETPVIAQKYISPASLLHGAEKDIAPEGFTVSREYSGNDAAGIFSRVDALLERYAQSGEDGEERFTAASFGTIAHICAGALLSGQEPSIPHNLAGRLTPADSAAFLEAGKELALLFIHSPLGIIARASEQCKTEFPFRTLPGSNETFINGTIDLVFEDEQKVYVVDFKTDSREHPGAHIPQMACYYRAASDLFAAPAHKQCTIWLYYLRSGHAVEVTEAAREFNLEKVITA